MTCPACAAAETNFLHPQFWRDCLSCQARRIALSPAAHRARSGDADDLRAYIDAIWKDDYKAGRQAVWQWMERIAAVSSG